VVKIGAKLASAEEPAEGGTYIIVNVETVKTAVRGFEGVRVTLQGVKDKKEYATMLWQREVASPHSKLGAFLAAFTKFLGSEEQASDTANWVGHKIRIVSWKPRDREVVVLE
jgi:hypothetical protein